MEEDKSFESFLRNKEKGITLIFSRKLILENIYLYSQGYEGNEEYSNLPFGLNFSMNQEDMSKRFQGISKKEGGNRQTPIVGWMNLWESYILENAKIKIHYCREANKIEYIVLSK